MDAEINLIEYGIYLLDKEILFREHNSQSPKDYFYSPVQDVAVEKITDKIPLILGGAFGIKFSIDSEEDTSPISIVLRIKHPELENPETNFTFTETVQLKLIDSGDIQFEFYSFDYTWEMVPGFWTFQVEFQSNILLTKEFEIYAQASEESEAEELFFYDM